MRNGLVRTDFWTSTPRFYPWLADFENLLAPVVDEAEGETGQSFSAPCDVEESESHYLLSFDLPGVAKEDLKIEVIDKRLTVSGERKNERRTESAGRHLVERSAGSFKRSFTLPVAIDASKVEASYQDGVLRVAVAKAEQAKPQQIKIADGAGGFLSKFIGRKATNENVKDVKESSRVS